MFYWQMFVVFDWLIHWQIHLSMGWIIERCLCFFLLFIGWVIYWFFVCFFLFFSFIEICEEFWLAKEFDRSLCFLFDCLNYWQIYFDWLRYWQICYEWLNYWQMCFVIGYLIWELFWLVPFRWWWGGWREAAFLYGLRDALPHSVLESSVCLCPTNR
jgi:hypothetical protein